MVCKINGKTFEVGGGDEIAKAKNQKGSGGRRFQIRYPTSTGHNRKLTAFLSCYLRTGVENSDNLQGWTGKVNKLLGGLGTVGNRRVQPLKGATASPTRQQSFQSGQIFPFVKKVRNVEIYMKSGRCRNKSNL